MGIGSIEQDNRKAFERFYIEQYSRVVNYTTKKTGSREDAEDIVHDAFAACYRSIDKYDSSKSTLATWIYVSVNNRIKNYYRDRKMTDDISLYSDLLPDENATEAEQIHYVKECREVLERILQKMSDRNRTIIVKRYFENSSMKDIASELGMTEVNVRVSIGRILKNMKEILKEEGWEEDNY